MTARDGQKRKIGRPTKYKPEYADQVVGLCKLGATVDEIAEYFSVATSTIDKWIAEIPDFSGAVKEGRIIADQRVAESLYAQALEGNTTAAIFWLKNRRSSQWREKQEHTHDVSDDLASLMAQIAERGRRAPGE